MLRQVKTVELVVHRTFHGDGILEVTKMTVNFIDAGNETLGMFGVPYVRQSSKYFFIAEHSSSEVLKFA